MSYPPRSPSMHRGSVSSISSSTGDHYNPNPSTYSYGPPPSSTGSLSPPPSPPLHSHFRTLSTSTNRSRARRLSLLGSPLPARDVRRESDAFGGQAYDDALAPDEEEALEYELEELDAEAVPRGRRDAFQPLTKEEKWWMGASAAVVLLLTIASCVMTTVA